MRFSYILLNKEGRGRRVPRGQAWQWIHEIDSIDSLEPLLEWIDMRVTVDNLSLLNVYLDQTEITAPANAGISFGSKSQVTYSWINSPNRVIDMGSITRNRETPH